MLTADIVGSRHIPAAVLERGMSALAEQLEKKFGKSRRLFEFYRGDSFQALVEPADALMLALLWRAGLKANPEFPDGDIRIGIGLGTVQHVGESLAGSAGQAFEFSGMLLDELKKNDDARIGFRTSDSNWNDTLNVCALLAEGHIRRWTQAGAETTFQILFENETQDALALKMGVSQPAIHKRLQAANWTAIRSWEAYYRHSFIPSLIRDYSI